MNFSPLSPPLWESSCTAELNFRPVLKLFHSPCVPDSVVLSMLGGGCHVHLRSGVSHYLCLLPFSNPTICLGYHSTSAFHTPTCHSWFFFKLKWKDFFFSVWKLHAFWFSNSSWSKGVEVQRLASDYRIVMATELINIELIWHDYRDRYK